MRRGLRTPWPALVCFLLLPLAAMGQWPTDPAVDLFLADGPVEQAVPHLAPTSDGGCYVGWYETPSLGIYKVYLQRLSPAGVEMWPHGGIMVSDHPSDTWVMDWDLLVDREDNAVLAFNDLRNGEFDVQIYKIGPDGSFLWGPDGISVTDTEEIPGPPSLTETTSGDIVVVWPQGQMTNDILMQRLSPAGELRLEEGGLAIAGHPGDYAFGARVIAALDDEVLVAWIPDSTMDKPRHLAANKFDAEGRAVWSQDVSVFDDGNIPIGNTFEMRPDGQGGVFLCWISEDNLFFDVRAQHLGADGGERWPHNGLDLFPSSPYEHIYPAVAYDPAAEELYVFARSQTTSQSQWGLDGQKLGLDGSPRWGDAGITYLPVDYSWVSIPLCTLAPGGGVVVAFLSHLPSAVGQDCVLALRAGADGETVWASPTAAVCSTLSDKLYMRLAPGPGGAATLLWQDKRSDYGDILAKSLNLDGTLGLSPSATEAPRPAGPRINVHPNPFNPRAVISFDLERAQTVQVVVTDLRGRVVASLGSFALGAGPQEILLRGVDDAGRELASGTYVVRLMGEDFQSSRKVTLLR